MIRLQCWYDLVWPTIFASYKWSCNHWMIPKEGDIGHLLHYDKSWRPRLLTWHTKSKTWCSIILPNCNQAHFNVDLYRLVVNVGEWARVRARVSIHRFKGLHLDLLCIFQGCSKDFIFYGLSPKSCCILGCPRKIVCLEHATQMSNQILLLVGVSM